MRLHRATTLLQQRLTPQLKRFAPKRDRLPSRLAANTFSAPTLTTSMVFFKGHRIRLEVSSSNFPRFDRNPNTGNKDRIGSERHLCEADGKAWSGVSLTPYPAHNPDALTGGSSRHLRSADRTRFILQPVLGRMKLRRLLDLERGFLRGWKGFDRVSLLIREAQEKQK